MTVDATVKLQRMLISEKNNNSYAASHTGTAHVVKRGRLKNTLPDAAVKMSEKQSSLTGESQQSSIPRSTCKAATAPKHQCVGQGWSCVLSTTFNEMQRQRSAKLILEVQIADADLKQK